MSKKILLITGPTAIGKTALGIKAAQALNGEIISADCIQIYKDLDTGSAKPTKKEKALAKHHLIDFVDSNSEYTVQNYKETAEKLIKKLESENKTPIFVGGTGLYLRALLFPYNFANAKRDEALRVKYKKLAEEKGNEYVHSLLKEVDLDSYNKLHPNDLRRVIRALEIYEQTGKPKSDNALTEFKSKYEYTLIALTMDRQKLYDRINKRVDLMFENGLEAEVNHLVNELGLTEEHQSMKAIGYKEFFAYFKGNCNISDVKDKIKQHSRNYAKRQLTWLRTMPNVKWVSVDNGLNKTFEEILKEYNTKN